MQLGLLSLAPLTVAALLGAWAPSASAQTSPATGSAAGTAPPARTISVDAMDKLTGTVEAVDKAQRRLSIKGPGGNVASLSVDPAVRNFDQIKVGDTVVVRYLAALSLTLMKDGKALPDAGSSAAAARAPAAAAAQRLELTAEVTAVDAATQKVTLRGPKQSVTLQVNDPVQFKAIRVGDRVQAVYSEAMALSVEPATGATPAK